jgi:hypothetical protein
VTIKEARQRPKPTYRIKGMPFGGEAMELTPEKAAAVDALLAMVWGDDRDSQITISIRHRGRPDSGARCTAIHPICWTRVNHAGDCTCNGFERERGGVEIIIQRLKSQRPKANP